MKHFCLLLVLLVALIPVQTFGQGAIALGVTNAIPATSTNTANVEIAVGDATEIGLQFSFNLASAVGVNSNITATLERSVDGTTWVSWGSLVQASSGTSTVSLVTNLAIGAIPRLRVGPIINANTVAVQSLTFWRSTPKRTR